jgi:hypothetical protein
MVTMEDMVQKMNSILELEESTTTDFSVAPAGIKDKGTIVGMEQGMEHTSDNKCPELEEPDDKSSDNEVEEE